MEKMLNVGERIVLMQLLPKEGNFATLRLLRDMNAKIGLSADELTEFEVVQEGINTKWNQKGLNLVPIDFKNKEIEIITKGLNALDKDNKLDLNQLTLFEKFVSDEDTSN